MPRVRAPFGAAICGHPLHRRTPARYTISTQNPRMLKSLKQKPPHTPKRMGQSQNSLSYTLNLNSTTFRSKPTSARGFPDVLAPYRSHRYEPRRPHWARPGRS